MNPGDPMESLRRQRLREDDLILNLNHFFLLI
jgi:hypothetical protein